MKTIIVFSHNIPGLLYRIAGLFLKRKINVESLTVSETEKEGISRFTIVVDVDDATAQKLARQIERIVEVSEVHVADEEGIIGREMILVRIHAKSEEERTQIEEICKKYWAHIIERFSSESNIVVEIDGSKEKIDECVSELKRFEIQEFVRSGRIALVK